MEAPTFIPWMRSNLVKRVVDQDEPVGRLNSWIESPAGMFGTPNGDIYVTDTLHSAILQVNRHGMVRRIALYRYEPADLHVDSQGQIYFIRNNVGDVTLLNPSGKLSCFAPEREDPTVEWRMLLSVDFSPRGELYYSDGVSNHVVHVNVATGEHTQIGTGDDESEMKEEKFDCPAKQKWTEYGEAFVADYIHVRTLKARRVKGVLEWSVKVFAGSVLGHQDGPRLDARFNGLRDLVFMPQGGGMLLLEQYNMAIRLIDKQGFVKTLIRGLKDPFGMVATLSGDLLISQYTHHEVSVVPSILLPTHRYSFERLYAKHCDTQNAASTALCIPPELITLAYPGLEAFNEKPLPGWPGSSEAYTRLNRLLCCGEIPNVSLHILELIHAREILTLPESFSDLDAFFNFALLEDSILFEAMFEYCTKDWERLKHKASVIVSNANANSAPCAARLSSLLASMAPDLDTTPSTSNTEDLLQARCSGYLRTRVNNLWSQLIAPHLKINGVKFNDPLPIQNSASALSCDFEIIAAGGCVRVHSWVLSNRWRWFSGLLDSGLTEAINKSVTIPDEYLSFEDLCKLLRYIYTNKLDHIPNAQAISTLLPHLEYFGIVDHAGLAIPPFDPLLYRIQITTECDEKPKTA